MFQNISQTKTNKKTPYSVIKIILNQSYRALQNKGMTFISTLILDRQKYT